MASCECCGLEEECTQDYIIEVKSKFEGKWLCGLCSEAVRDELNRVAVMGKKKVKNMAAAAAAADFGLPDAVRAHMSFCGKYNTSNPAFRVADGMMQMLRRRSAAAAASPPSSLPASPSSSSSSSKKLLSRSASTVSFY
ncbi:unnamed protein product [Cuscuta campestris]|uniref:DUF1677 domain-containing protein n=1 Tax=Cuscuta campestris TaxID=132261 RepID=A0A484KT52_9ASTE|nr:unnamed protein product [Cuscuta campestris]